MSLLCQIKHKWKVFPPPSVLGYTFRICRRCGTYQRWSPHGVRFPFGFGHWMEPNRYVNGIDLLVLNRIIEREMG